MARSLQHLMRKACSSIQSKASCLLAYEEKGRRIQPFPSQQTKAESHLARKPECASAHWSFLRIIGVGACLPQQTEASKPECAASWGASAPCSFSACF